MNEAIEKTILDMLDQVSESERMRNRALEKQTAMVLKAIKFMKATTGNVKSVTQKDEKVK